MNWTQTKQLIKEDYNRHHRRGGTWFHLISCMLTNASFRMTFWFRIGSYLQNGPKLLKPFYSFVFLIHRHNQYKTGIQLYLGTKIDGGLYFPHYSCIVIARNAIVGKNCTIFQGVTIGSMRGNGGGTPVISDNVVITAGAKVIGNVRIGENVMIGSNAVVVKDVPNGSTVAGVPAKVISNKGIELVKLYI